MPRYALPSHCSPATRADLDALLASLPVPDDAHHPTRLVREWGEDVFGLVGTPIGEADVLSLPFLYGLFEVYDTRAFAGMLSRALPEGSRGHPRIRVSNRMTRAAGKTTCRMERSSQLTMRRAAAIEITLSRPLLSVPVDPERGALVSGRVCRDRLDTLLRVFEHELVHVLLFCIGADARCSQPWFRHIATGLFGHRDTKHHLVRSPPAPAPGAPPIRPGDRVRFRHDGQVHEGIVNRITKRATVLVEDPRGAQYSDGVRYLKFYVPLPLLERVA